MALDKEALEAIRLLLREEIKPLEQQVGSLDTRVGSLGQSVEAVDKRMTALEEHMGSVEHSIKSLDQRMGLVEKQLSDFRTQVDAQFTEVQNNFESLYARDEKREQEYVLLREQSNRTEQRVTKLEKKVA